MFAHQVEYLWSCYQKNAIGKPTTIITPQDCYFSLNTTDV